jgi:hypothetical protein
MGARNEVNAEGEGCFMWYRDATAKCGRIDGLIDARGDSDAAVHRWARRVRAVECSFKCEYIYSRAGAHMRGRESSHNSPVCHSETSEE